MTKRELLKKAIGKCVFVRYIDLGGKVEIGPAEYSDFRGGQFITDVGDEMFEVTNFVGKEKKVEYSRYYSIASSIMKCNTWESRKGNAILSGYGKIQSVDIDRKRHNNHHAFREEIPG